MREIMYEGRRAWTPGDEKSEKELAEMLARPRHLLTIRYVDKGGQDMRPPSEMLVPVGVRVAVIASVLLIDNLEPKEDLVIIDMPAKPREVKIECRKIEVEIESQKYYPVDEIENR